MNNETDAMLDICKKQGYVPEKCYLVGVIVWSEVNRGVDPCVGCNHDRKICEGRPKNELAYKGGRR